MNGLFKYKDLGTYDSNNIENLFIDYINKSEQKMRIGNYFKLNDGVHNNIWIIIGINTYVGIYGTSTHHVVICPRAILSNVNPNKDYGCTETFYQVMNSTATTGVSQNPLNPLYEITQGVETAGYQGFYGSDMYQIHLPAIANNMRSLLGDHMMQFNTHISNYIEKSVPSTSYNGWNGATYGCGWYNTYISLMTETQVYGSMIRSSSGFDIGEGFCKFPYFNFMNPNLNSGYTVWLRSVTNSTSFAALSHRSYARYYNADQSGCCIKPIMILEMS